MHELFAALTSWLTGVVQSGNYAGLAGLLVLENLFPPIPSELILPVAGFLVGQGKFAFGWVVVAATLGSVAGALILYGLGYKLGEERLRAFARDHGRWLALSEAEVEHAKGWFDRHGGKAVLLGRLVPTVRSIISIPAGVSRMPLGAFILYTTLGSGIWNAALVAAGWLLGNQWERLQPYLQVLEWGVLLALGSAAAWFLWQRKGQRSSPTPTR
jgi:membrane protein DedA with SNARE-associated domain